LPEVSGQVDEVGNGDNLIVVDIALTPAAALIEVRGKVDEVADADGLVKVEIANDGVGDDDGIFINALAVEGGVAVGGR